MTRVRLKLDRVRRRLIAGAFPLFQFLGIHVTPNHFYSPIPDTRTLPKSLWEANTSSLPGIDFHAERQRSLVTTFRSQYLTEFGVLYGRSKSEPMFDISNAVFGPVDAELLYSFVRSTRPKRIIEVGSGQSSVVISLALHANGVEDPEYSCDFIVIDPFPSPSLGTLQNVSTIHELPVETLPIELFLKLHSGDILFIDSSHVLRTGNDVHFEYLHVIPALAPGVLIHIHDIFLPAEYPREWIVGRKRFWSEQYLLQAFLSYNSSFETVIAANFLHQFHYGLLDDAFPSYGRLDPGPGSYWLRRVK